MIPLISLFNVEPIAADLANRRLVITPNQRLASRIGHAYGIYCREHNHQVVTAPRVYALSQWLDKCWQQLLYGAYPPALAKTLLSAEQQLVIFEQIIETSEQGQLLLRPTATAQQVSNAFDTLLLWEEDTSKTTVRAYFSGEDSTVLLTWIDSFNDYCQQHHFSPPLAKYRIVMQAFSEGVLTSEAAITTVAFEDFSPLQTALLTQACEQWHVLESDKQQADNACVVVCDSQDQEIVAAALWAKQVLQKTVDDQPLPTVAIVIPDLAMQRERVLRIVQSVIEPDYIHTDTVRRSLPFNFSAGNSLADEPVIKAAIDALELSLQTMTAEQLVTLLQSPFYGWADQSVGQAVDSIVCLIEAIYAEQSINVSGARLRYLADKVAASLGDESQCEVGVVYVSKVLAQQANIIRAIGLTKSYSAQQWAEWFNQLIFASGWPGQRTPDTIEYQALDLWQSKIALFVQQYAFLPAINASKALALFKQLLTAHIFQPQSNESPLQVLGLLEASGLQFDHLWLCSMSANQWPASPKPNPLLPLDLQREKAMPNATAERELAYSKRLSERFLHSADNVIISYAKLIDDNPASVSDLFSELEQQSLEQLFTQPLTQLLPLEQRRRRYQQSAVFTDYDMSDAPILSAHEVIKGGTSLFTNQSACPFRSFATHRLQLSSLPEPVLALNHGARGSLLHRALELIWKQLENLQALTVLNDGAQQTLCENYAEFVLNEYSHRRGQLLGIRYQQIEKDRLASLLSAWLNVERQRAEFTVYERESEKTFQFAQLQLTGRVDRVDQLSDGRYVIIDYKTGRSGIKSWWGTRPDEPQLPLYSALLEQEQKNVAGIAFAQVRSDDCQLKGVGDSDISESTLQWTAKIQSEAGALDWSQLKQQWVDILSALAQDFIDGKSAVDPKQRNKTCQYCDLSAVCRIGHQQGQLIEEEAENNE